MISTMVLSGRQNKHADESNLFMLNRDTILKVIDQTLKEKSPFVMVQETIKSNPQIINKPGGIKLFALGKASLPMTEGFCAYVDTCRIKDALIISHQLDRYQSAFPDHFDLHYSPHPLSSSDSLNAAEKAINFFKNVRTDDNLICLISGGGSSMMMKPIDGMAFETKKELINKLIFEGIPEREVNEIRKSLSQVKGGKLLTYLPEMEVENIFLSDERLHKFDAISSGPTIKDHDHLADHVIEHYGLHKSPDNDWIDIALAGNKPALLTSKLVINNTICGTRSDIIDRLKDNFLKTNGVTDVMCEYNVIHSVSPEEACTIIIEKFEDSFAKANPGMHVLIIPAEIQVKADPKSKGGRNQHLTAMMMQRLDLEMPFSFIAYATDGVDFIDGVVGAHFDKSLYPTIIKHKDAINKAIATTSTYNLHEELGTLIRGKKTGHNISDLIIMTYEKL